MILWFLGGILALFILEAIAEACYRKTTRYKASDQYRFTHAIPDELQIVNIGSAPGFYDISYKNSPWKGFNFSTAPQSFKYSFRLLKHFQSHIKSGGIIIIIIITCPLSFARNKSYADRGYSDRYYGVLPREEIDNYSFLRAALLRKPLLFETLKAVKLRICPPFKRRHSTRQNGQVHVDEPAIVRVWKEECGLNDLHDATQAREHQQAFLEKTEIVRQGLALCQSMHWTPILVVPPIPSATKAYISDEFRKAFVDDNITAVLQGYENIPVLDYWDDARIEGTWFQNDFVMNEQGRERFSTQLFEDIQDILERRTRND